MKLKGVVVGLEKNRAAVLTDDGRFARVRNKNYRIGENIDLGARRPGRNLSTLAACFMAVLMIGGMSTWAYAMPYTSVSLDVEPSIVLDVNRFDQVIDYEVSGDMEKLLTSGGIDPKNMDVHDAVSEIIKAMVNAGIIVEDEADDIAITVNSKDQKKTSELIKSIKDEAQKAAVAEGIDDVDIEAEGIGYEMVQRAKEYADENDTVLTPGKLNLITKLYPDNELKDMDDEDIDAYAEKTVKEIMQEVKAMRTNGSDRKATPAGIEKKTTDGAIQKQNNGRQGEEQDD